MKSLLASKLNILEPRYENDIDLPVKEVGKTGNRIKIEKNDYKLASFDHFKSEIFFGLNRVKHRDLEDMVHRLQLTYDETVDFLDVKSIAASTIGYLFPPGVYKINDINLMLNLYFLRRWN